MENYIQDDSLNKTGGTMPLRDTPDKKYKIGIAGIGMVGGAIKRYFEKKPNYELFLYDKKGVGSVEEVNKADYIYVCIPTPYVIGTGCDTSLVEGFINQLTGEKVIIIKSTVAPGTTDRLQTHYPQHKFIFSPEFLTEETGDQDMSFPDSQIIGYTNQSYSIAKEVLQQLPLAPHERIVPCQVAEFIKYAKNSYFAVKVAVNNELYDLGKKFGLSDTEWDSVVDGLAADRRVGRTHLKIVHRGKRGYWGKCLPKDLKAIIDFADKLGVDMSIRKAVDTYNDKLLNSQGYKPFI
jgi:UDPglucose 6-dehydrogenase